MEGKCVPLWMPPAAPDPMDGQGGKLAGKDVNDAVRFCDNCELDLIWSGIGIGAVILWIDGWIVAVVIIGGLGRSGG